MKPATIFSEQEIKAFKNMIGKQFEKIKCDPFIYSPILFYIPIPIISRNF